MSHDDHAHHVDEPEASAPAELDTPYKQTAWGMFLYYMKFWVGLVALAACAVGIWTLNLSTGWTITLLLLVSTIMGSLQLLFLMHFKSEKVFIFQFMFFTILFAATMLFLTILAHSDPIVVKSYYGY